MSGPEPSGEGVLVGSGGFKVDRAHALEKLRTFSAPSAAVRWLPWARCAAACGARDFALESTWDSFTLRFAGAPFTRAELDDPFAPLFAPRGPGRERGVQLALGLVQALGTRPREVAVESGTGTGRLRLLARSAGDMTVTPAPGPEERTRISVCWGLNDVGQTDAFLNAAEAAAREVPLFYPERLRPHGAPGAPWPKAAEAGRAFCLGSAQGVLAPPAFHTPPDSHLSLYKLGVYVCEHREPFPWAKVQAWVNDDKLALTASQAGVARDARFKGLMRLAARESEALVLDAARGYPELLQEARTLMRSDAKARDVWSHRLKWGPNSDAEALSPGFWERLLVPGIHKRYAECRRVLAAAERTLWLKDVAARLAAPGRTPPPALAAAVRAALAEAERGD